MRQILIVFLLTTFSVKAFTQQLQRDSGRIKNNTFYKKGNDHIDLALEFEINRTKDPVTGKVPRELLAEANREAKRSQEKKRSDLIAGRTTTLLNWTERGSNSDAVGPSNGNTRPNAAVTSGRMRAMWADLSDASGNTVWVGGVDGGIWKTSNITVSPATWVLANDYLSNLAVSGICQDPSNTNVMYFCTGESFYNADAVNGNGVYKSTDGGVNWTQLSSTSSYTTCSKILCDATGNVYLSTIDYGMKRSKNGGSTWTDITPTGLTSRIADFEISSTGRMHISCGLHTSSNGYRFTNNPSTVINSTWVAATTPFKFPSGSNSRVEMACTGNVLYAALSNSNAIVDSVSKSTDGGVTWITNALTTTAKQALNGSGSSSQAWYCLTVGIHPTNPNYAMIGNLNIIKTTDGGGTWVKGSEWAGGSGQYVHADQHAILWYNNGNRLLFGSDGGIHFSSDSGTTIRDRNVNLRIKQFYSVAIHPTSANYFLAGAQDNGVHQFNTAGLGASVEVTGGDGAFVAIDQNQPQIQFGAYVYNSFRRSINSGSTWASVDFYKGTNSAPIIFGSFINPYAYDNTTNIIYAGADGGEIFRWSTPQTTASGSYYQSTNWPSGATLLTGIINLYGNKISAVTVSPNISNRLYFGTENGKLIYVDNANTAVSNMAGTNITGTSFSGTVSSINFGTDEKNIIVTLSNYNITNIWVSSDSGRTWTGIDGNLANMPVRWAMFYPNSNTKAIIATEAGVWETDAITGNNTVWTANPSFPVVRTDMLQYRSSDRLLAAATHGRGLFTTNIPDCTNTPTITVTPASANFCYAGSPITLTASGGSTYRWSPSTGLSATAGSTVSASPTSTTTYVVNGFDANGCSSSATTVITVLPGVNVSAIAMPPIVCNGGNATLTATASLSTSSYCQPVYVNGTNGGDYISQVTVATTTLNNFSGASVAPYYTLFPASGSSTGTFNAGSLYTITVKGQTNTSSYIRGWIDYNQDGIFSNMETIGTSSNAGLVSANFQFTIPPSALNGTSRLRLRSSNIYPGAGIDEACGSINSNFGETEDYIINITNGANAFSYVWSPSTFLSSTTSNTVTAHYVSNTTSYTVTATSGICSASAVSTVNLSNISPPSASNNSRCGIGNVNISANTITGNTIDWYASSTGGAALLTASDNFTTPSIDATTIYYAEARNILTGCISDSRTAVTANVYLNPATPNISAAGATIFCDGGSVTLTSSSASNNVWSTGANSQSILVTSSGNYSVTVINASGCTASSAITAVTVNECTVNLNLTLFLEGYYIGDSNMKTTLYDLGMNAFSTTVDTITVNLWSPIELNNLTPAYTQKVILHKNGTAAVTFPGVVSGNNYYIAVKHQNHLETWSSAALAFSTTTNYNFSTGINKALGDGINPSMKNLGENVFGFYGGDVNQDGAVDGLDMEMVENGASSFEFGYHYNDVTGDGATDALDLSLIENNAQLFLFYARP